MSESALHVAASGPPEDESIVRARSLAAGLFPHQVEGVAFLLARRRAILADDMGLGKTRQSIVALTEAAPEGPYLVVAPASVKQNWAREIGAILPEARVHVVGPAEPPSLGFRGWVLVNYDILGRHLGALEAHPWSGLVFDEAHYLKNHRSQRSRYARSLVAESPDDCLAHTLNAIAREDIKDGEAIVALNAHAAALGRSER